MFCVTRHLAKLLNAADFFDSASCSCTPGATCMTLGLANCNCKPTHPRPRPHAHTLHPAVYKMIYAFQPFVVDFAHEKQEPTTFNVIFLLNGNAGAGGEKCGALLRKRFSRASLFSVTFHFSTNCLHLRTPLLSTCSHFVLVPPLPSPIQSAIVNGTYD